MQKYIPLIVVSLIALLSFSCAKHTPTFTNIGVVELEVGKASRHELVDGRELVLTPISINTNGTAVIVGSCDGIGFTNNSVPIGQDTSIFLDEKAQVGINLQLPK
jgi:hypothetical protein